MNPKEILRQITELERCLKSLRAEAESIDLQRQLWLAGPGATPKPHLPPIGDGPRRKILVEIEVPENFETRLDMQWVVEREIHADRWEWEWANEVAVAIDKAMRDHQAKIAAARKTLEAKWNQEGDCGSCGWHAALSEYAIPDSLLAAALEQGGVLELPCKSQDDEDCFSHRGVTIYLTPKEKEKQNGSEHNDRVV